METFIDSTMEFSATKSVEENGKLYIEGEVLTQDYECEEGLKTLSVKLENKDYTWRHRHPLNKADKDNHVYGVVRKSWVDETLHARVELYDHTEDHQKLVEDIKLRDFINDPLSFSMHYRTYFNEKGEKIHYDVFELAGTPFPHCKKCKINKIGVIKLEKDTKIGNELEESDETSGALKKIEELEKELNSKTKFLEEMQSEVKKLEAEISVKDLELEKKQTNEKTLEDRVLELENKVIFLNEKKPILDKLYEADESIDSTQAKWLETQPVKYLTERLEEAQEKAKSTPIVKELDETIAEAKNKKLEEETKVKEVSFEQFISHVGFKKERS